MYMYRISVFFIVFFFFQAEDGIRDHCVTGVQTCALPIYEGDEVVVKKVPARGEWIRLTGSDIRAGVEVLPAGLRLRPQDTRSEERRVGKERGDRSWRHSRNNKNEDVWVERW